MIDCVAVNISFNCAVTSVIAFQHISMDLSRVRESLQPMRFGASMKKTQVL